MVRLLNYCKEIVTQLPIHGDFLSQIRKKECIFIFKEKLNQFQVANPIEEVGNITEEEFSPQKCPEDLIGTPLECPFNLDVLKIKDDDFYSKEMYESHHLSELKTCKYRPFSSFEARQILTSLMGEVTTLPIFCLCDAEDGERTSILGIEKGKNKELTHYKITVNGPFKSSNQSIQFDALKSEMTRMVIGEEFSSRAFAVYEAYRGTSLSETDSAAEEDAFVRLECSWKNPSKIFEIPHIASQAKVVVRPLPGETCSGAYEIWRQLNTLQHLISGVKSLEIVWFVKQSNIVLQEEIDRLIVAFSKDEVDQLKGKMEFEELYDDQLIYKRTPMDFIDRLWELLSQNCSSFSDLSQSLQYTLQRAKADHPMVFFDNPTRFGKMLRQNDAPPQFKGMEPVNLLIEMGIEKLKRDYLYIFSGNNLVAERVISSFLPQDTSPLDEQLKCLTSIQSALEVLCLCQRVLQLPHLTLRDIVGPLLEHYQREERLGREFSFQLGVCLLKGFFQHQENGSASVEKWAVEFSSSADSRPTKLVCQLTASSHLLDDLPGTESSGGGRSQRFYNVERYLCKTHKLLV